MGADYKAYAVIGVRVKALDFFKACLKESFVPAFTHTYPNSMKFDPQTGKPLWKSKLEPIDGYREANQTIFGYPFVRDGNEGNHIYICAFMSGSNTNDNGRFDEIKKLPLPNVPIAEILDKMRDFLAPIGIWDETEFGMWAVLSISS